MRTRLTGKNFKEVRKISQVANNILKKRYYSNNETEWENVVSRVITSIIPKWKIKDKEIMYSILKNTYFVPNSPCLVNAGRKDGGLAACFVVDFKDDTRAIFKTKLDFALIARKGGGCGTSLSKIRPEGDPVAGSTHGYAGGAIKFADTISHDMEAMTQSGFRNMAIMFTISIYHPDIIKFITAKEEEGRISNANISVVVDNNFMNKVINDRKYWTEFNGKKYKEYSAKDIFNLIVEGMWRNGEPGILFKDRIDDSPYKDTKQEIFATNPCSEQPLPPNGICNLGSLDLSKFVEYDENNSPFINYEKLEVATRYGTRFLDAVVDASAYPTQEIAKWAKQNRSIGLGIMGYADMLLMMQLAYGSKEALEVLASILSFIKRTSYEESENLAKRFLGLPLGAPKQCRKLSKPRRNITVNTIAPTGCQVGDTIISTRNGFLRLDEIGNVTGKKWQSIDLEIFQENNIQNATKFYVNGKQETKKITFSSGLSNECTYNHKYRILDNDKYIWKRADELNVGDKVIVPLGLYDSKHVTKLKSQSKGYCNETTYNFPTTVTEDLAKFLGIYFGDGSNHKKGIRISCNSTNSEYLEIAYLGETVLGIKPTFYKDKRENCISINFNSRALLRWLEENGIKKQKSSNISFTKTIRSFNAKCLKSFMEGFYVADGSEGNSSVYIDTASKKFAKQWIIISRALGTDCVIQKHTSGKGSIIYRVRFIKTRRRITTLLNTIVLNELGLSHCTLDAVYLIENSSNRTYDIEVPSGNTYTANGILSHNTVSLIAGCSSGIEPIFSEITIRNDKTGTYTFENNLANKPYFRCAVSANGAKEVTWEEHVDTLSTCQKYIDSGISKTVNFPKGTHRDTIGKAIMKAWQQNCKGLAVYRNGSRKIEVLTPKNLKKDKCPICSGELVKIDGKQKCPSCKTKDAIEQTM